MKGKRSQKTGLPPGSLVYVGDKYTGQTAITLIQFDSETCEFAALGSLEELTKTQKPNMVSWLNVEGLGNIDVLSEIGNFFSIHPLTMEDILNTDQRPKIEFFDDYVFIIIKMIRTLKDNNIDYEQVSLILKGDMVITFQEREGDVFDPIRERIRTGGGRIRKNRADYLAYALLDIIADHYFLILENFGERIEALEDKSLTGAGKSTTEEIHGIRHELLTLRKYIWPLRTVMTSLMRDASDFFSPHVVPYLRDLNDHVFQAIDTLEIYRDSITGVLDIYLSSMSNKMNDIMRLLTVISTIFIPLTFIVGIYGMNFKYMPELDSPLGYPIVWGFMILLSTAMIWLFKRKKWL